MSDFNSQLRTDGITVYSLGSCGEVLHTLSRKGFYKIMLLSGAGTVNYGGRSVEIKGPVLLVTKPGAVCSWSLSITHVPSYMCVIAREFFDTRCFNWVNQCNLFSSDDPRVYNLNPDQSRFIRSIFQRMIGAQKSEYPLRTELMQDQTCVLLHTVLRLKPFENYVEFASTPISASRYVELIAMSFPTEGQVLHFN